MRYAGRKSWSIRSNDWQYDLEWALWLRAAERIPIEAGGDVPGPLDIDPVPDPSVPTGELLREGWLSWWHTLLGFQLQEETPREELMGFQPGFEGLEAYPELRQVIRARWPEMNEWHSARRAAALDATIHPTRPLRELEIVRAVETDTGHTAEPFDLRLIIVPTIDNQVRRVGGLTFLVSEQIRATDTYDRWLYQVVRAIA